MVRVRRGFTLIELLIALAVIGVIAAIAIPNLLNALQRGRQKRTMEDMRAIATACAAYAVDADAGLVQASPGALSLVASYLGPTYLQVVPTTDAWAGEYIYEAGVDAYTLTSLGRDGRVGGGDAGPGGVTTDFDADIIISDGAFIQYPEGIQD